MKDDLSEGDISHDPHEEIIEQEEDFAHDFEPAGDINAEHTDQLQADRKEAFEEQNTICTGELSEAESKTAELEQVMTSGMQFLGGLFKMSTGKDLGLENQQIKINKETGEVTMTFKLPI